MLVMPASRPRRFRPAMIGTYVDTEPSMPLHPPETILHVILPLLIRYYLYGACAGNAVPFLVSTYMQQEHDNLRSTFESAYDAYFEPIFLFLALRLNDRERAKELAQETFTRTWQYIRQGNTIRHMRPFLYRAAHNMLKNEIRGKRGTLSLDRLLEEERLSEPADEDATSPETRWDARGALALVYTLSPAYRDAILLRYAEGLSIHEIASILNVSPTATAVRIHRGIKRLRLLYEAGPRHQT